MISILRQLDIDLKKISTTLTWDKFAAAIALTFNDMKQAAESLANAYDISLSLERDVLLCKLNLLFDSSTIEELKKNLETTPARAFYPPSTTRIPGRLMPKLLDITIDHWLQMRREQWIGPPCPPYKTRQPYTIAILSQLVENNKKSEKALSKQQYLEGAILEGKYYRRQEVIEKLSVSQDRYAYLVKHNALGKKEYVNSKIYFLKDNIDEFLRAHVKLSDLAQYLDISTADIRMAMRIQSIDYPLFTDWPRTPFFVETKDVPAIHKIIAGLPKLKYSLGNFRSRRTVESGTFISIEKAATILNKHSRTVKYYRDLGLVSHHKNHISLVLREDVIKFHRRYATPTELGGELNISSKFVSRVLQRLGIFPIAGPNVTGTASLIYDRSTLPKNLAARVNPHNDKFGELWLNKDMLTIEEVAKTLSISALDTTRLVRSQIQPQRAPCYRNYFGVSTEELSKLKVFLQSLTALPVFLLARKMTYLSFQRRFTHPKYVKPIEIRGTFHLTPEDLNKLDKFLNHYCTPKEADRILGAPAYTASRMISLNKLKTYFLPNYHYKHPVLMISEVLRIATPRHT
ncbi:hypothetical protein [Pseudomonas bohemica]|nr:hypothetical protein [Pseudomonas bohemica]